MIESQNIEWKLNWHDDYLKWVCGFANAFGGTIFIGIDDNGEVSGLKNYKELLEIIPNKIREHLAIVAQINVHTKNNQHYIEIIVPQYNVAISLRGRYYYRTGSTKLELTGHALNEFLLKKSGKTWDSVVEQSATFDDIDESSVQYFLNDAKKSGRMFDVDDLSIPQIFEKLRLSENNKIKRAGIVLFAKDPNRFYTNVTVKLGRFGTSDDDLRFQEVEEGNIIQLLKNSINQLSRKFLIKNINFEGLLRIETDEYPSDALREMLLNALVHRTYTGVPIQLRVYDNKLSLWNEGALPKSLTFESLKGFHISIPKNPLIADICFRAGYIDSWGRGTLKIIESCKQFQLPEPKIEPFNGGILVTLFKSENKKSIFDHVFLNERQILAYEYVKKHHKINNKIYQSINNVSRNTATSELRFLVNEKVFKASKIKGAGSFYEIL